MQREILNTKILERLDNVVLEDNKTYLHEKLTTNEIAHIVDIILDTLPQDKVEAVAKFHETYNQPINDSLITPNLDRLVLRLSLIFEELTELAEAMGGRPKLGFHMMMQDKVSEWGMKDQFKSDYDIIEVADALADLEYVLNGTILETGLRDKFDDIFDEIQASNMSKTCKTEDEAKTSVAAYKMNEIKTRYKQIGDVFIVYREEDDKVLKGVNYFKPNIKDILL